MKILVSKLKKLPVCLGFKLVATSCMLQYIFGLLTYNANYLTQDLKLISCTEMEVFTTLNLCTILFGRVIEDTTEHLKSGLTLRLQPIKSYAPSIHE